MSDVKNILTMGNLVIASPRRHATLEGITSGTDWIDWSFKIFFSVMIALVVMWIFSTWETSKHCAVWENKIVHQAAYTTWIFAGKTMIPIYHPAGDYDQSVCTKPK